MKQLIFILIIILLMPCLLNAQELRVGIAEILDVEALGFNYNQLIEHGEPLKVSFELYNTGSVDYKARVRLDVLNRSDLLYSGWSDERIFNPGTRHYFEIYYPVNAKGNFTAEVRVYYANEIEEIKSVEFEVKNIPIPERAVEITDLKTYEDEVEITIKINETLENIIIIPSDYPSSWIFEQKKIESMKKNEVRRIELQYEPPLWKPSEIKIDIVTEDGKYHTSESFMLEREGLLRQFLHDLSRLFRRYLSVIL